MARMIRRTGSWLWWLAGLCCAVLFGSRAGAADTEQPAYGVQPPPRAQGAEQPPKTLEDSKEWTELCATWKEAEEIASGSRGAYPFDRDGKKKILEEVDRAAAGADTLVAAGLLLAAEAELLKKDLAGLRTKVQGLRVKEMELATCYEPVMLPPAAQQSAARLAERLPLLEKLVAGGNVHKTAIAKVLARIEDDLAVLADDQQLAQLKEEEARAEAEKTRDAVKAQLEKLKGLLGKAE